MASIKISALPGAGTLEGIELVPIVQGDETAQTTIQDIADLAGIAAGSNTFIGSQSGTDIDSGRLNVGMGSDALFSCNSGNWNVAIGSDALIALTTGSKNTALGFDAGSSLVAGSGNILIGYGADVADADNQLIIGNDVGAFISGALDGGSQFRAKINGTLASNNYTVSTLPAPNVVGDRAFVTDALAPAFGAAVVGGGAVPVPVYSPDGTTWSVG